MEAEKRKPSSSNGGYSLIELIVSVLISGVVMLAVVGFLTSGLRHFRNVNSESLLQMESQMTELFLTELIQEATDFRTVSSSELPAGVTAALEIERGTEYYMLAQIGNELRFGSPAGGNATEKATNLMGMDRGQTFLAQYVTSFSLSGASSYTQAKESTFYKGTMVTVQYQVDEKSYTSSSLIGLQNIERN